MISASVTTNVEDMALMINFFRTFLNICLLQPVACAADNLDGCF